MPRSPRYYSDKLVYEIVPRAKDFLPMPPTETSNEIRLGILGRTQRDNKVELCHFVDMNNHSHSMAVSTTGENLSKFHMELKKKTTDALKALLGLSSLSLWEKRTGVFRVVTLEDAIERVVYIYCNPSNAGLCDSIEQYPGLSSWSAFRDCAPSLDAEVEIEARWYPVSEIPTIQKARGLSQRVLEGGAPRPRQGDARPGGAGGAVRSRRRSGRGPRCRRGASRCRGPDGTAPRPGASPRSGLAPPLR